MQNIPHQTEPIHDAAEAPRSGERAEWLALDALVWSGRAEDVDRFARVWFSSGERRRAFDAITSALRAGDRPDLLKIAAAARCSISRLLTLLDDQGVTPVIHVEPARRAYVRRQLA